MGTSLIWLQDVHQITPLDIQEGRITRWLKEDIATRVGVDAADAMSLRLIEWPGDRYQWSVRDSAQTAQRILHKQRVCNIAIICNTPPASRLDVFDFITEPMLPASGHETGNYPPFSPGRLSVQL
jgi:hypothetical protein